ncbi:MAG TPA: PEP-CTERM sorting domain-containing protein [Phycisphaerae bacterium]|nr:PEP-CTERM sorting domain-containing protein [Phycisphaerae bacterium]
MKGHRLLVGLVLLLMLMSRPALGLTIDAFTDGDFTLSLMANNVFPHTPPPPVSLNTTGVSMIDSDRDVTLTMASGTFSSSDAEVDNSGASGSLAGWVVWTEGDNIRGTLQLLYDGAAGSITNGINDFTDAGASKQFLIGFNNDHPLDVTIEVWTGQDGGGETAATASVTKNFALAASFVGIFPFAEFTVQDPNLDLTDVDKLLYTFDSTPAPNGGGDYALEFLESGTIPEPVTVAGLLIGLSTLAGYVRRRAR